ncbi:MAG TPA: adenosine kinase [Candidatus Nanoarchaeia archaeon]|nr:adenosine kinase [Candidatus Nanoarchaeia archaeon]
MKKDVLALSNAITDIFIEVNDRELEEFGLKKGVLNDKEIFYASSKFHEIIKRDKELIPGGSSANVAHDTAVLGLKSGLMGTIGKDDIGKAYKRDVLKSGLENLLATMGGESGVCYILTTPDGEKTLVSDLKVSKNFYVYHKKIDEYQLFHTCGYELITNPEIVFDAMKHAKKKGLKLSFDLADPSIPKDIRKELDEALRLVDYLTLTEEELEAYTGLSFEKSIHTIKGKHELVAVKKGARGSEILTKDKRVEIPRCPTSLVNTTGAGDAYMAGLIYGIQKGWSPEECGRMGSYTAAIVCGQQGARLCKLKTKKY